jgi:hypothetical protein
VHYVSASTNADNSWKLKRHNHLIAELREVVDGARFTNVYSDYGIDVNKDGLYDFIIIEVGVNVTKAGNYRIGGNLCDSSGEHVDYFSYWTYLNEGNQMVKLYFKGVEIRKNGVNGTFDLKFLDLKNHNWNTIDHKYRAYRTSCYNYTDFPVETETYFEDGQKIIKHIEPIFDNSMKYTGINASMDVTNGSGGLEGTVVLYDVNGTGNLSFKLNRDLVTITGSVNTTVKSDEDIPLMKLNASWVRDMDKNEGDALMYIEIPKEKEGNESEPIVPKEIGVNIDFGGDAINTSGHASFAISQNVSEELPINNLKGKLIGDGSLELQTHVNVSLLDLEFRDLIWNISADPEHFCNSTKKNLTDFLADFNANVSEIRIENIDIHPLNLSAEFDFVLVIDGLKQGIKKKIEEEILNETDFKEKQLLEMLNRTLDLQLDFVEGTLNKNKNGELTFEIDWNTSISNVDNASSGVLDACYLLVEYVIENELGKERYLINKTEILDSIREAQESINIATATGLSTQFRLDINVTDQLDLYKVNASFSWICDNYSIYRQELEALGILIGNTTGNLLLECCNESINGTINAEAQLRSPVMLGNATLDELSFNLSIENENINLLGTLNATDFAKLVRDIAGKNKNVTNVDLVIVGENRTFVATTWIYLYEVNATITSPTNGSTFMRGDAITFNGTATGGTPPYIYNWTSSIDGEIGNNLSFTISSLSVGMHEITSEAIDSSELKDSAQITIFIYSP